MAGLGIELAGDLETVSNLVTCDRSGGIAVINAVYFTPIKAPRFQPALHRAHSFIGPQGEDDAEDDEQAAKGNTFHHLANRISTSRCGEKPPARRTKNDRDGRPGAAALFPALHAEFPAIPIGIVEPEPHML